MNIIQARAQARKDIAAAVVRAVKQQDAGICGEQTCACCWTDDAQLAAETCAEAIIASIPK